MSPNLNRFAPLTQTLPWTTQTWLATGINVFKKILDMKRKDLTEYIADTTNKFYGQPAKPLQIDMVANLVMGCKTVVLAGTGFGKSRIAEIYYKLIPQKKRVVVLVLNPLDSLGNNQVFKKELACFTAINLNKLNFNKKAADNISNSVYQFVYMNPEIFLNNKMWEDVYFSLAFQNRLGLIVVDEAHMIYIWGLVKSGPGKHLASMYGQHKDQGIFQPSYGNLGGHLFTQNKQPILLLSAYCCPVAVEAIKKILCLEESNIDILRGKLTRPEIRIVRVPMESSMALCHDLIKVFPSSNNVPDAQVVPLLVYSGSQNQTLTALEVIGMACEAPGNSLNPTSLFACQYHSCTGKQDKLDCIEAFSKGTFPVFSCTMALGLGQNWKQVQMVVHMGRGDPAAIVQMVGQCGPDSRHGLAILFVEKNCRNSKNHVTYFREGAAASNDNWMDALAITPVCLRICFSIDSL
ncbi:hypothetical protein PCANC_21279 [Puccinia coronata f. sp. avenae]|uniref:DNA 3'-5' helicase n=1 Tax=Puccinia coronata f. sp. avenae TaxID=200324 RepID=A0A2N5SDU9_9BASI|nr:hypothetical protein PCANC_21279 [Puccinia coronata f. sp. avenae]